MRLTAIVPNYNHGHVLPRAIDALSAQTPRPDEILIIDDASTDDSREVLQSLGRRYATVRIIHHTRNLGAIAALNRGISEARGRYIYFGAADDRVLPGLFALGLDLLKAYPAAAFACAECQIIDQIGAERGIRPLARPVPRAAYVPASQVPHLLRRIDYWAHTSTAVLRRDAVEAAGGLDPALGSFADGFLLRRLALRHGFCFAPQVVAQWTLRPEGLSRSEVMDPEIMKRMVKAFRQQFAGDADFPPWYPELFERRLQFASAQTALRSASSRRDAIEAVSAEGALDRLAFRAALAVPGQVGRILALGWLTLRMRPMSVLAVAQTAVVRRLRPSRA